MNGFLAITYAFMLSFCPYQEMEIGHEFEHFDKSTHTEITIGLELFNCVNLFAGEGTYQVSNVGITSWRPYTQKYIVGVEYHKTFNDKLKLKVGYKHECHHPVEEWKIQLSTYNYCCSELYVGIEGKIDIF